AALAGFMDFMLVPEIRRHFASWSHMLAAILLLAVAGANLVHRWAAPVASILPWGLYLSLLMVLVLGVAGWLGGQLAFVHNLGAGERRGRGGGPGLLPRSARPPDPQRAQGRCRPH